jgi:hypothetical protein
LTLVFWIRSYWRIDHLHGILWGEHRLFVRSGGGEIVFTEYMLSQPSWFSPYESWEVRSHQRGEAYGTLHAYGDVVAYSISRELESERPVQILWTDENSNSTNNRVPVFFCHGVAFPHLLLLLITGSLFFLILRRWQFSLRTFFIWVTIACIAMASAVAFVTAVKEIAIFRIYD